MKVFTNSQDQFLGALFGVAIGDAMGMPVKGWTAEQIQHKYGRIKTYQRLIREDGLETMAGDFSDETEITLCIVESMTTNDGEIDLDTVGSRLVFLARGASRHWLSEHERQVLDEIGETLEFQVPINERDPATGSVATRGVPIGLAHALGEFHADEFRADIEKVVRLTHGSTAAFIGALAVGYAVNIATRGEIAPDQWITATVDFIGPSPLADMLETVASQLAKGISATEIIGNIGFGENANQVIATAFLTARLHPENIEDAILFAVNAGGATDSRAAIVGALLGARYGTSGMQQHLIDDLESRIYVSLAAPWFYRSIQARVMRAAHAKIPR